MKGFDKKENLKVDGTRGAGNEDDFHFRTQSGREMIAHPSREMINNVKTGTENIANSKDFVLWFV